METCQKLLKLSLLGHSNLLFKRDTIVDSYTLQYIPWVEEQDNRGRHPKQLKK